MTKTIKKITSKNFLFVLIVAHLCFLFFLPPIDGNTTAIKFILLALFGVLSLVTVLYTLVQKRIDLCSRASILVIAFFVMCMASSLWAMTRSIPFGDVLRGIMPFLWLSYILFLPKELSGDKQEFLIRVLSVIAALYSLRIIVYFMVYVRNNIYERVTFHLFQSTSFLTMFGVLLFLYLFLRTFQKKYIVLFAVAYISVVLTETKSMMACVIGGILVFAIITFAGEIRNGKKFTYSKRVFWMLFLCLGITVILFTGTKLGYRWRNVIEIVQVPEEDPEDTQAPPGKEEGQGETPDKNYSQIIKVKDPGSVSDRLIEYKTAIEKWKHSPVFGQGLGYRWSAAGLDYGGPVIYMHNVVAFCLMDFGIIGILYLLAVIISLLFLFVKVSKCRKMDGQVLQFYFWFAACITAFVYANFFAVFRSIEFVLLMAVMISMVLIKGKEIEQAEGKK